MSYRHLSLDQKSFCTIFDKMKRSDHIMPLLERLGPLAKLDIISKLAQSLKSEIKPKASLCKNSFGAWSGTETAEDMVKAIRDSRNFSNQTEIRDHILPG